MTILNIFAQDAFSVMRLTDALREIKYTPSRIGQMGLFQTTSIDTLDTAIEKDKEQNRMLVSASPRGGPGQTFDKSKRAMRLLTTRKAEVVDVVRALVGHAEDELGEGDRHLSGDRRQQVGVGEAGH